MRLLVVATHNRKRSPQGRLATKGRGRRVVRFQEGNRRSMGSFSRRQLAGRIKVSSPVNAASHLYQRGKTSRLEDALSRPQMPRTQPCPIGGPAGRKKKN